MKYIHLLVIALCFFGCNCNFGCSATNKEAKPPVITIPDASVDTIDASTDVVVNKPKRTDLPPNWSEMNGEHWSYGVPDTLYSQDASGRSMLAGGIAIEFSVKPKKGAELTDHIFDEYVTEKANALNIEIVAERERIKNGQRTVALQIAFVSPLDMKNHTAVAFFQEYNGNIYMLSFEGEISLVKKHSNVFFDILDTLKLF